MNINQPIDGGLSDIPEKVRREIEFHAAMISQLAKESGASCPTALYWCIIGSIAQQYKDQT